MLRFYVGGDTLLRVNGRDWHGVDPFRHNLFLADSARLVRPGPTPGTACALNGYPEARVL